jgi:hypothetical protein
MTWRADDNHLAGPAEGDVVGGGGRQGPDPAARRPPAVVPAHAHTAAACQGAPVHYEQIVRLCCKGNGNKWLGQEGGCGE